MITQGPKAIGGTKNTIKGYKITLFYCIGGGGGQKEILPKGPPKGQGGSGHTAMTRHRQIVLNKLQKSCSKYAERLLQNA